MGGGCNEFVECLTADHTDIVVQDLVPLVLDVSKSGERVYIFTGVRAL